jgi:DNA-binding FrmR family transcriptional regulator
MRSETLPLSISADVPVYLTPEMEGELIKHLSRLEEQVRGLRQMLLDHQDSKSLLRQIAAMKMAITAVTGRGMKAVIVGMRRG